MFCIPKVRIDFVRQRRVDFAAKEYKYINIFIFQQQFDKNLFFISPKATKDINNLSGQNCVFAVLCFPERYLILT